MIFRKKKDELILDRNRLPRHIAFIMDGNGRWAKKRGLPRTAGHHEGGKALLKVLNKCNELGIEAITVFAFSTENWSRPKEEVEYLMKLPNQYIKTYLPKIKEANIKMNFIGFLDVLPEEMKENIRLAMQETKDNTGMIFTIALNYGAQDEILYAVKQIAREYHEGNITLEDITKEYFEKKLFTSDLPPIDLMVRTSGELRISNFLLWQIAYSELYFVPKLWPDFNEKELRKALIAYQKRKRRFGGIEGV